MTAQKVIPGDKLGPLSSFAPGNGTHARHGFVYASMCGYQRIQQPDEEGGQPSTSSPAKPELHVVAQDTPLVVPKPGNVVTCKITRVQQNSASCRVLCVGSQALSQEFKGTIRQQDVRATEIDKVVMYDCFRPGDVVQAEVVSLGDARSYYLSTAKNELGVVWAKSVAGFPMVPTSWTTMQCPETLAQERRKVAKVPDGAEKRKAGGEAGSVPEGSRKAAKVES